MCLPKLVKFGKHASWPRHAGQTFFEWSIIVIGLCKNSHEGGGR